MSKLVVIDGNSIMNRAFYGLSGKNMLMTKEGIHTNAVYGFLTILFKILLEDKPEYLVVAFDLKAPTFRHKMYEGYKAQRKGMPDELAEQMPIIKEVLDAMNISRIEMEGFEADDILGTLSKKAKAKNIDTILFTGDRDSFQLIEDGIVVKMPVTKGGKTETEVYDSSKIYEKYGLNPIDLIEVKGLMGDASDNIPGVPGIGEKTALSYIKEFKTIDNLYENLESSVVKPKSRLSLKENRDLAYLSRTLAIINTDIPLEFSEDYKLLDYDNDRLYELFNKLEFISLIKKLNLTPSEGTVQEYFKPVIGEKVNDTVKVNKLSEFAFFVFERTKTQVGIFSDKGVFCIDIDNEETLKSLFENDAKKYGINTKPLYVNLISKGIKIKNLVFDLAIAQYVVNPNQVIDDIENFTLEKTGFELGSLKDKVSTQISFFETQKDVDNNEYVCSAAKIIWQFKDFYLENIKKNNQEKLFNEIEMPLIEVLAGMQVAGIKVERNLLQDYGKELQEKIDMLEEEIFKLAGEEFNLKSPKQLGDILFEKLGLPAGKKTHRGYATDADTLENLRDKHPIIGKILEHKQYIKLKSTYIDGLEWVINPVTGRIHSNFNQTSTATGRLSSTEPNLQNIPVRMEAGKKIRKMFVPSEGNVYIDADYSQIELRVLADMSNDGVMINSFNNDEDIHTTTASQIFHIPKEDVTPKLRSKAKAVNFGIVYGQSEFTLGQDLGITRKEAKEYIDMYFEHFFGIKEYMNNSINFAKEKGYVETIFHRRRYVPEIKSSNFNLRSFGERIAMNMPIQGSAADIIKIAMVEVYKKLEGKKSKLILQVHDELLVETAEDEIEEVSKIVKESMENATKLKVKLKVDLNTGSSWLDAK